MRMKKHFVTLALLYLSLLPVTSLAQVRITRIVPADGPPGTNVIVHGAGFTVPTEITIDGVTATVTRVTPTNVTFTIPPNARSGTVVLTTAGESFPYGIPFQVTRPVQGVLSFPAGVNRAGYNLLVNGTQPPVNPDGTFTAFVPVDAVAYVWAYRQSHQPAFMAVIMPDMNSVTVSARSTAEALVMSLPGVTTRDPQRMMTLRSALNSLAQLTALEDLIASASAIGQDYLDDARVLDAWFNAVVELSTQTAPMRARNVSAMAAPETPRGTFFKYINPPAGHHGYPDLRRLEMTLNDRSAQHPTDYRLKIGSAGRFSPIENPVDWYVELYELDPRQFTNGLASVAALTHEVTPRKMRSTADRTAIVSASLFSKNLDLIDVAAGWVTDWWLGPSLTNRLPNRLPGLLAPDEIPISSLTPGVYVVEAYSGNVFWGTEIFNNSPPSQSELITRLQNRQAWGVSLGANMVVAAVDGVPVVKDMFGFIKKTRTNRAGDDDDEPEEQMKLAQEIAWGVGQDLIKAIAIHGNDPANSQVVYDLFKTAVSSIIKNTSGKLMENAPELVDAPGFIAKSLKLVGKTLDVFGKASSFLQATERITGLFANSVLAVERSVIVVGDPFGPKIESFTPQTGRGGEILTIVGYNFPTNTNNVRVSFCQFASTTDPNQITAQIVVPVYDIHPTSISVRVPTNGPSVFPNLRAVLCVEVLDKDFRGTTQSLDPPYREFVFVGPPELTGLQPEAVFPGGLLQLQGRNLSPDIGAYRLYFDGVRDGFVQLATTNSLMVQVPTFISTGLHSVAVQVLDVRSAPMNFTIKGRTLGSPGQRGRGLSIRVTKADFSNVADGEISLLEGVLIANGTLGRAIERHLPCESLPPTDPQSCPRQRREVDHIQYLDEGPNGGPNSADLVFLDSSITNATVATGVFPPLSSGDSYVLRMTIDGGGAAGSSGLVLDGASEVSVDGLKLRNYGSHGIWLRNGASFNTLDNITIENCGGSGAFLDGNARNNDFFGLSVSNAALHGLHLSGPDVRLNVIEGAGGRPPIFGGEVRPYTHYMKCGGNGIRIDNGASFNNILPGTVRENNEAGILITGAGTGHNFIGRGSDETIRDYDVVKNGGPGVHLTDGVQNCVVRYINAAGNEDAGILLEGPGCAQNQVDRCIVGVNRYEGGTSLDLPNQGSGIHLRAGAHHNLIGSDVASFGDYGAIGGNLDDGILIEGSETSYNGVTAQQIGLHSVYYENGFLRLRFLANGRAGIRLRDGAHHNTIGTSEYDLPNFIFSSLEAAIVIEGGATRQNIVFGNQIGTYHQQLSFSGPGQNNVGIWIKDGANANTIGLPGEPVGYPKFPPFGPLDGAKVFWNVIARCVTAGILIENSGGDVGTDGVLRNANIIQNNLIGEEERFAIAPNATGIKLGPGAHGNIIGGPLPLHRNRIRGNWRAGIWIQDNHVPSPSMRNRVQNNFIAEQGITGFLRYPTYLTETPSGGIGLLIENSSGHVFGEDLQTTNFFNFNRLGIYLANSGSNTIQGNWVSNHFVAGVVVRGGSRNLIGGDQPELANQVSGFGLNDPGQGGVVLSHTTENVVAGNFIGFIDPGRGGVGLLITNAAFNQIGGGPPRSGNVISGNSTNGVLLTGPETLGNNLLGNFIGVDRVGRRLSNRVDGVRIEAGANHNHIGGYAEIPGTMPPQSIPSGNVIAWNAAAGVRVDGVATIGNSILFNSITGNGDKGIAHSNGGNQLIPPPNFQAYDGLEVSGNVELARIPPGSVVQIFCDPDPTDPEGDVFLGQGIVGTDSIWRAVLNGPLLHPVITMTASHAVTGSTSEFGTSTATPIGFRIQRTDGQIEAGIAPGAIAWPVFRLSLTAVNADVRVHSIAFDVSGSLPDVQSVLGASIYWDLDQDGHVGPADQFLGGRTQFTAENGRITLATTNAIVGGNTTQRWLLAFDLAANAPLGSQFRLTVTNAEAVDAEFIYPARLRALPTGNFAINSAQFTIVQRQTIAAWKQTVFSAAQLADPAISGNEADPDGDGFNNVLEYAFNLDPNVADRDTIPNGDRGGPMILSIRAWNPEIGGEQEFFGVMFIRRKAPVDLNYHIQDSVDLLSWATSRQSVRNVGDGTRFERVTGQAAHPKTGPGAAPQQFIHVQVELLP
jgi:hypothetical protein